MPIPEISRIETYKPGTRPDLFTGKAILLSASVPHYRPAEELASDDEREQNRRYVETADPERIRAAVTEFCRFAFIRDISIIFGAHPAISPMVLRAAHRFARRPERPNRVVIFQSRFFEREIPKETLLLADWTCGELLWTEEQRHFDRLVARRRSLTQMRLDMIDSPNLIAAVFIGGMEGVIEEAEIFRKRHEGRPHYAIASTGGAAGALLERRMTTTSRRATRELLLNEDSYALVFQAVFADLDL